MRASLEHAVVARWYGGAGPAPWLLPFEIVFRCASAVRRFVYRHGVLRVIHLSVPVAVVGNLTVGGTGKTPLVLWLAQALRARGRRPGIVSRGYGGRGLHGAMRVLPQSDVNVVGDEALLLARR